MLLQSEGTAIAQIVTNTYDVNIAIVKVSCPDPHIDIDNRVFTIGFETTTRNQDALQLASTNFVIDTEFEWSFAYITSPCELRVFGTKELCVQQWTIVSFKDITNSAHQYPLQLEFQATVNGQIQSAPVSITLNLDIECPVCDDDTTLPGATMALFRDNSRIIPYTSSANPPFIVPDSTVCTRVDLDNTSPAFTQYLTLNIDMVWACISTTSVEFIQFNPLNPFTSGCYTPGTFALMYTVYDANAADSDYDSFAYRLDDDPTTSHSMCFNASVVAAASKCAYVQVFYHTTLGTDGSSSSSMFNYMRKAAKTRGRAWVHNHISSSVVSGTPKSNVSALVTPSHVAESRMNEHIRTFKRIASYSFATGSHNKLPSIVSAEICVRPAPVDPQCDPLDMSCRCKPDDPNCICDPNDPDCDQCDVDDMSCECKPDQPKCQPDCDSDEEECKPMHRHGGRGRRWIWIVLMVVGLAAVGCTLGAFAFHEYTKRRLTVVHTEVNTANHTDSTFGFTGYGLRDSVFNYARDSLLSRKNM